MRFKYYIRGLGAGIVLTTIVLTVSDNIRNSGTEANNKTTEQTTSAGSALAYTTTTAATQNATENTTSAQQTETTGIAESATTEAVTVATGEVSSAATSNEVTMAAQQAESGKAVSITIKNVYYSAQAADILYNAGLIDDRSAFNSYMQNSGYATKIKEGNYSITKGASFEEIAQIITKTH
jgi:hypothetical protein